MEDIKNCPLCRKKLHLKQINFTTAIFICVDVKCSYPVNEQCIVVNRKLENINERIDLLEAYKKYEELNEVSTNVSESTKISEGCLMLDLEELLNEQSDQHCFSEKDSESSFQGSEETDVQYKTTLPHSQAGLLELPELDDFLVDLLR